MVAEAAVRHEEVERAQLVQKFRVVVTVEVAQHVGASVSIYQDVVDVGQIVSLGDEGEIELGVSQGVAGIRAGE